MTAPCGGEIRASEFPRENVAAISALYGFLEPGMAINTYDRVMDEDRARAAIITHRLHLLELLPEFQPLVVSGNLSVTMAWAVSLVPPRRQLDFVKRIASGQLRTAEQARHAALARRDADAQIDAFANEPKVSTKDVEAVSRLERKIDSIVTMVRAEFKDGECVAAQRVSADRVKTIADKLALVRKHVLQMEHGLRRVATQPKSGYRNPSSKEALMKALSIRQPYAWLIVAGHKPIENRTWLVHYRGPLLIHASAKMHVRTLDEIERKHGISVPREALELGGIIGRVDLVEIVTASSSPWFEGPFGWVLENPTHLPFRALHGAQGLFNGPDLYQ